MCLKCTNCKALRLFFPHSLRAKNTPCSFTKQYNNNIIISKSKYLGFVRGMQMKKKVKQQKYEDKHIIYENLQQCIMHTIEMRSYGWQVVEEKHLQTAHSVTFRKKHTQKS